jgi:membrane fusion protein, multidrug efflux system
MSMTQPSLSRTIGIAAAVLAITLASFAAMRGRSRSEAAVAPQQSTARVPTVPVVAVVSETVPIYLEYVGTTDSIRNVTLEAEVTGYLVSHPVADGADVTKGQLLYQIDPRAYQAALDQARAQAERDAAAHEYAAANHRRDLSLSQTGDVSVDTLQQATSSEQQESAAQASDRAAIETAQLNLGYTSIRAPFPGRLSLTQVHEGALITVAGTQLNTLVQLDPIYATFNPPEADLPRIEQAQKHGAIRTEVLVGEANTPSYYGKLTFLDNSIDRTTGTITARATVANPARTLLPGQFIRVRLHLGDQPGALLVPQVAVTSSQLGTYVYVAGADNRVEQRSVTLGTQYGALVVVSHGVSAGEHVLTGGLLTVNPGMQVRPVLQAAEPASAPDSRSSRS